MHFKKIELKRVHQHHKQYYMLFLLLSAIALAGQTEFNFQVQKYGVEICFSTKTSFFSTKKVPPVFHVFAPIFFSQQLGFFPAPKQFFSAPNDFGNCI